MSVLSSGTPLGPYTIVAPLGVGLIVAAVDAGLKDLHLALCVQRSTRAPDEFFALAGIHRTANNGD